MTKTQKIWLIVFLAIAILPEVLWSPVYKFWYALTQPTVHGSYQVWRHNFLENYGNSSLWSNLILLQFFGLFFTGAFLVIIRKKFNKKLVLWVLVISVFVIALYVLNLYRLSSMRFTLL